MTDIYPEILPEIKIELLSRKLAVWENTLYDAGADEKLARILDDKELQKAAQARMKQALKAIEALKAMIISEVQPENAAESLSEPQG